MQASSNNNGSVENRLHQLHQREDRKTENSDDVRLLDLDPTTEAGVRLLAQAHGDHLHEAESIAAKNIRAKQAGARSKLESKRSSLQAEANDRRKVIAHADRTLAYEEPTVVVGKRPIGVLGTMLIVLMLSGLIGILWIENGAAANLLMGFGAFSIKSIWASRALMATPLGPSIAGIFGCRLLSIRVRRWVWLVACALMIIAFGLWAIAFAVQVARLIQASESSLFDSISEATSMASGAPAMIMFGALVLLLSTTCFVGHSGLEAFLRRYEILDDNPRYLHAFHERQGAMHELRVLEAQLSECDRQIATLEDEEQQGRCRARTLYKALKYSMHAMLFVSSGFFSGCSSEPKGEAPLGLIQPKEISVEPIHRLYAIADSSDESIQKEILGQFEQDLNWLSTNAAVGTTIYVVDAWSGAEVARFVAVDGVKRIRRQAMVEPAKLLHEYLTRRKSRDAARVRIPRLAQLVSQLDPLPLQVCVLGNPLYDVDDDTSDTYYSMIDGRVGSDGMLFETPSLSPFSVVGRGGKLANQSWHLGWHQDQAGFKDETHRLSVLRFWHLYLQEQGAKLVTAQDSISAVMQATRNGLSKQLMNDIADRSQPAAMVRIVKIVNDANVQTQTLEFIERAGEVKRRDFHFQQGRDSKEEVKTSSSMDTSAANTVSDQVTVVGADTSRDRRILMLRLLLDEHAETSPMGESLTANGFQVEIARYPLPREEEFSRLLSRCGQVWIWSSPSDDRLPPGHLTLLCDGFQAGTYCMFLLADNAPYLKEANHILDRLVPGTRLAGNYRGEATLNPKGDESLGFDSTSPIFDGVQSMFEGTTVSRIENAGRLQPLCFSSDGAVLIATWEHENGGRLVVDGGFTRFYRRFWNDDAEKLAINIANYLAKPNRTSLLSQASMRNH